MAVQPMDRPLSPWRMASVPPNLLLSSQPQSVTTLWPLPSYTDGEQRHAWTTCPRLLPGSALGGSRTCNLGGYKFGMLPLHH